MFIFLKIFPFTHIYKLLSVKEQVFHCVQVFSSSHKLTVIVQEISGLMSHLYIISATETICILSWNACLTRCALCI